MLAQVMPTADQIRMQAMIEYLLHWYQQLATNAKLKGRSARRQTSD